MATAVASAGGRLIAMGMEQGPAPASGAKPGSINEPCLITDGENCSYSPAWDCLPWDPHSLTSEQHGTVQ